jgi:UDP-3-O-[3-hydroxymyristoyl] glucosamine N-acyltransferase
MAGVSKDCEPGKVYSGIHARPMKEMLKVEACTRRLPHLYERVDKIEEALGKKSNPKK